MYGLTSIFTAEKNKKENAPILLFTITDYDGAGTDLNLAEHDVDVVYDGVTYTAFPIKHEEIGENSTGEIDKVQVGVSNVNRIIQGYLELYDLRGKKVTATLVWLGKLDDTTANMKFIYYIENYTADAATVQFILSSKFDILDVTLPNRIYHRNYCTHVFKGTACGYTGGQLTCDKRKTTCETVMNNLSRYGGFPSIPMQRIYV